MELDVVIDGETRRVRNGITPGELLPTEQGDAPVVAALVDDPARSLDLPLGGSCTLAGLTTQHWEGQRIFRSSLALALLEANASTCASGVRWVSRSGCGCARRSPRSRRPHAFKRRSIDSCAMTYRCCASGRPFPRRLRGGERKHIFPFQHHADEVFDTSLVYELSVPKVFAELYLLELPADHPAQATAERLLELLASWVRSIRTKCRQPRSCASSSAAPGSRTEVSRRCIHFACRRSLLAGSTRSLPERFTKVAFSVHLLSEVILRAPHALGYSGAPLNPRYDRRFIR